MSQENNNGKNTRFNDNGYDEGWEHLGLTGDQRRENDPTLAIAEKVLRSMESSGGKEFDSGAQEALQSAVWAIIGQYEIEQHGLKNQESLCGIKDNSSPEEYEKLQNSAIQLAKMKLERMQVALDTGVKTGEDALNYALTAASDRIGKIQNGSDAEDFAKLQDAINKQLEHINLINEALSGIKEPESDLSAQLEHH